ncbi:MAG: hypothetical protein C5B59_07980 [Bacteroidetes bacterium]|nr:MAG: hypothetical protein C5B59_07980 [Bacteroidota bacterium]
MEIKDFGDILRKVAADNISMPEENRRLVYTEMIVGTEFRIRLRHRDDKDALIEVKVPWDGGEECKNYARFYFLSMVFNAAVARKRVTENRQMRRNNRSN